MTHFKTWILCTLIVSLIPLDSCSNDALIDQLDTLQLRAAQISSANPYDRPYYSQGYCDYYEDRIVPSFCGQPPVADFPINAISRTGNTAARRYYVSETTEIYLNHIAGNNASRRSRLDPKIRTALAQEGYTCDEQCANPIAVYFRIYDDISDDSNPDLSDRSALENSLLTDVLELPAQYVQQVITFYAWNLRTHSLALPLFNDDCGVFGAYQGLVFSSAEDPNGTAPPSACQLNSDSEIMTPNLRRMCSDFSYVPKISLIPSM